MHIRSLAILPVIVGFLSLCYATDAGAQASRAKFGAGHLAIRGMRPGTPIGWMALVRERVNNHIRVTIHRGVARATGMGDATITHGAADARRAIWAIASLGDADTILTTAPDYVTSSVPIEAVLSAGATSLRIVAAEIHVLYVRPPAGAWFYDATDGSELDADHQQNGTIEVALSSLQRLQAGPQAPPAQIESGDAILLIDPRALRSGRSVVP